MIERFATYQDVEDCGPDAVTVIGVVFKEDFGPWKKGYEAHCLSLEGIMLTEWTLEGKAIQTCRVKLVPMRDA